MARIAAYIVIGTVGGAIAGVLIDCTLGGEGSASLFHVGCSVVVFVVIALALAMRKNALDAAGPNSFASQEQIEGFATYVDWMFGGRASDWVRRNLEKR